MSSSPGDVPSAPPLRIELRAISGEPLFVELGAVVAETPSTLLHHARVLPNQTGEFPAGLAAPGPLGAPTDQLVLKRGRRPTDFGRLDLERVACERLEHPGIARFLGASREMPLGTVLAFERLGPGPMALLNAPGMRPRWRDPGTRWYPMPPGIALELAHDVLEALEHVHACGFVHGGVTLGNLLVRTPPLQPGADPRKDVLAHIAEGHHQGVLAGLGGARELTFLEALRHGQADADLTPRPPIVVAAPETLIELPQLGGRLVWSTAMDAYAFGLLLYTLVTGRAPYDHITKELGNDLVVNELKLRETRGEVSPVDLGALATVPLHDSPFAVPQEDGWPRFHATLRHMIGRCVQPDPAQRPTIAALRALMARELLLQRPVETAWRRTSQQLFQMLPGSNRLRGEAPGRGIWVVEEDGKLVVSEPPADLKQAEAAQVIEGSLELGASIAVRSAAPRAPAAPQRVRCIPEPVKLRDVVRAFHTGKPLPVTPPCLLSTLELDAKALSRCVVHSLGNATGRVVITEGDLHEEVRIVMGRTSDNDVVLADPQVSKRHAALGFDRGRGHWYVEDMKSANGTAVDDEVAPVGKRIRIRRATATIELGEAVKVVFIVKEELELHLKKVIEFLAAQQVAAAAARAGDPSNIPVPTGFVDEMPSTDSDPDATNAANAANVPPTAMPGSPAVATRRIQRVKPPVEFPLVAAGDRRPPLVREVEEHGKAGAAFRIVLTGAIVKNAANGDEALKILRKSIGDVVRLEAEYPDRKVEVYRKT